MSRILERLGIVRHTLKKDLLLFFLPWLTVFTVALSLCRTHGNGVSGIWGTLWRGILHPGGLLEAPPSRSIGLALFVLGLTTMIVAQVTLWQNYSGFVVIKRDHQLITHGLYRFTRNPIYLGAFLGFAGLPIYAASLPGFLAMLPVVPIFLHRIGMEEKMLAEHFGAEYEAYRRSTRRLIPFLY
jgi:protein-S-isoprenylcysteine O-methyltransferase Ste14